MSKIYFRHLVLDSEESESSVDSGTLILLYNDVKEQLMTEADKSERLLEETASAFDEDKNSGIVGEIGMRCRDAVSENINVLHIDDSEEIWSDDDRKYEQNIIVAAVLDFLLQNKVISLPEEAENDHSAELHESEDSDSD